MKLEAEFRRSIERDEKRRLLYRLYPDSGPLRRELYSKHIRFFALAMPHEPGIGCPKDCDGSPHHERGMMGGNRTGKTSCTGYETTCHLIGYYPPWWPGRRFDRPVTWWVAGEDAKAMRESIEPILLGDPSNRGTGLIPGDNLLRLVPRSGVTDAIDSVGVRHQSGGSSRLLFKTYDQGRESYQGSKIDGITFDEEPPKAIYSEGLTRTMATTPGDTNGLVLAGFTPLKGLSEVVLEFMPGGKAP